MLMKNIIVIIAMVSLSFILSKITPWWSFVAVGFLAPFIVKRAAKRWFVLGSASAVIFWAMLFLFKSNYEIGAGAGGLSQLFGLPNVVVFFIVTLFLSAFLGGASSWVGNSVRQAWLK